MKWKKKQRNHYHNSERRKYEISILQALWNFLIWNREQSYLLCCQMQEMWQSELWKHSPSIQAKEKEWEIKKCPLFHKKGGGSDLTSNHNYFGVFLCINYTISQHLRQSKFRPQSLNDKIIKM